MFKPTEYGLGTMLVQRQIIRVFYKEDGFLEENKFVVVGRCWQNIPQFMSVLGFLCGDTFSRCK